MLKAQTAEVLYLLSILSAQVSQLPCRTAGQLERFNYSSREIIQPLHDSLSTHALEVTKLQSCLAFIFSSLLDEALIIFSAVCSAHQFDKTEKHKTHTHTHTHVWVKPAVPHNTDYLSLTHAHTHLNRTHTHLLRHSQTFSNTKHCTPTQDTLTNINR